MSALLFVALVLASHRIWRLVGKDDVLIKLRGKLMDNGGKGPNIWDDAIACPWCMGSLIAFALVGAVAQIVSIALPGLWALAVASALGIVEEWASK